MGPRLPVPVDTGVVIPRLVDAAPPATAPPPPIQVVRRDPTPIQTDVPLSADDIVYTHTTTGGVPRYSIPKMGPKYVDLTLRTAQQILGIPAEPIVRSKPVGLDLGAILTTVGQVADIYTTVRGGVAPAATPVTAFPRQPGDVGYMSNGQRNVDLGGVPFVEVIPEEGYTPGACWNPRANCGQGKWIKRRRRRRILASARDIRDIAALKSSMSPSEFKTWIATH